MISLTFANILITPFTAQSLSVVFLLIPVIIVEAILLKFFLRKGFVETLELCALANLISILADLIPFPVESLFGGIGCPMSFFPMLFAYIISVIVAIWIENRFYKKAWKDIPKRKLLNAVIIVNLITFIPLLILAFHLYEKTYMRNFEKPRRIGCQGNLKEIRMLLTAYAEDYNGFLPNKRGVEGFKQLHKSGYSINSSVSTYVCPSTDTSQKIQRPTENSVDYIYAGNSRSIKDKNASKIPVAWDKPTNHKEHGNVLFLDGHVKGFKGKDWMEQAGIKK